TYNRKLRVLGKEVPLTINQKNFEYQVLTESPLNIIKNLDLVKWGQNLFGIPFLNLGRLVLLGLAAGSTPVVLWYGSTRFPQLAREMKLYRDPEVYGENLPEFTKSWLLELSVRIYENTWNGARFLEPRAVATALGEWKEKRENKRRIREYAQQSEQSWLAETPARLSLASPCKNWLGSARSF
ncbi:MAG: hypothetical protein WCH11_00950, partial [Bdellovibrio sp.]